MKSNKYYVINSIILMVFMGGISSYNLFKAIYIIRDIAF